MTAFIRAVNAAPSFPPHDPNTRAAPSARRKDALPALLLVAVAHAVLVAAVLRGMETPHHADDFKPPTLSGVLVTEAAQQVAPPLPAPKAPPKPAPMVPPKLSAPPVQAPPTEHSITMPKAEPQEKPTPAEAPATQTAAVPSQPVAPSHASATAEPAAAPVVPPLADANHLNNPAPVYPMGARRRNEQGVVQLTVLVLADGTVGDLGLKRSSGYPELDESALKAVARWRFVPASRGGKAIDWRYTLPISFSLNP